MLGKNQIQITGNEFAGGLSTSDYLGDGGIGVLSQNLSMASQPGVVRATYAYTPTITTSGNPLQTMVASCEDPSSPNITDRVMVDTSGRWWHADGGGVTWKATGTASYIQGQSDMVSFNYGGTNYVFATLSNNIARYTPSTATLIENFWSVTLGQSAMATSTHPLLVYQGFLWMGDGNTLYQIPASGTGVVAALKLDPGELILTLGIDPGTGLMLISSTTLPGYGDYSSARRAVYFYDGYSSKARRKLLTEMTVTAFTTVGGALYAVGDDSVYIWNGNGFTFLRRLTNASSGYLVNRHRITNFGNTLVVANRTVALAYGDVQNGKKVWYPLFNAAGAIDVIAFMSNSTPNGTPTPRLCVLFPSGGNETANFIEPFNQQASSATLYTNNIYFPRPVHIHRMRVFTTGITTTAGIGSVSMINEKAQTLTPTVSKFVVASGTQYVFDFTFGGVKLETMQPVITLDTQAFGIVKAVIYYDTAE